MEEQTFSVSQTACKKLMYKLYVLYGLGIALGVLFFENIPLIPLKIFCICFYSAYLTFLMYNKKKRLKDVFRLSSQIVKFKGGELEFDIYDIAQNEGLKYTREEPICYRVKINSIKKLKKSLFTYTIQSEEVYETVLRRNLFTVKKNNSKFVVYRIFENDKELYKILKEL